MLDELDDSFGDSLDNSRKDDSLLTPSEKNELQSARRAVKVKSKNDNEQLMAIFQIIYLKIDSSIGAIAQLAIKKTGLNLKTAFSQIKAYAQCQNNNIEHRKSLVLATLATATNSICKHIQTQQKRLLHSAFSTISKEAVRAVTQQAVIQESTSVTSPNNRDLMSKSKMLKSQQPGTSGSMGMLPKNIITRKQHGLKEENKELKGKFERKRQPVRWFVQEMDQLLTQHEQFLKM